MFFRKPGQDVDQQPGGYAGLDTLVQSYAARYLMDPTSTFHFSLTFLRHGVRTEIDLDDGEPIYRTTCSIQHINGQPAAQVLERVVDDDFVGCIANGGCARCRHM